MSPETTRESTRGEISEIHIKLNTLQSLVSLFLLNSKSEKLTNVLNGLNNGEKENCFLKSINTKLDRRGQM